MLSGMTTTKHMAEGVAVHSSGAGPAVVLLHANGGNHRDFDAVVEQVAATHTVHAIDWPGWGDSPVESDPTALGYAALLPRVLHGLGGGPFVLIGNSVGGFAAIRTAATHPELVRGLVLVDPGGFTPRWPGTIAACRMIGSARLSRLAMRALPRLYLRRNTAHVAAIRERATIMSTEAERVRTFASIWRSFGERDHNARIDAARLTVPTLLVWGTRDPVLPWLVDGRRARRALPHAQVVTFPCGHQAFAEMPDEFVEAMMPFLHTIAAADAPT
jgi:pimeloyl-ACP methyl ester carboxylesterase